MNGQSKFTYFSSLRGLLGLRVWLVTTSVTGAVTATAFVTGAVTVTAFVTGAVTVTAYDAATDTPPAQHTNP